MTVVEGKEAATLAFRYQDAARIYLAIPFVLDETARRVAVMVGFTDGEYFDTSRKETLGWVVASPEAPGALADPPLTFAVEDVQPKD